jgi:hypothetical protein
MTTCRPSHVRLRCANRSALSIGVLLTLITWHRGSWGQDPPVIHPTGGHVPQLARDLDQVEIYAPVAFHQLAVFPVRMRDNAKLRGNWLTMDQALAQGVLVVSEKGARGVAPLVNHATVPGTARTFEACGTAEGGLIACGEVGPDVPPANIRAMYEAFHEYGGGGRTKEDPLCAP